MRKIILLAITVFTVYTTSAQDFSNKGKDFWVTSGWHYGMGANNPPTMTLSLTSDVNTTFSIEAYGVGVITTGSITANQITTVNIPSTYFTYVAGGPAGAGNGLFNGKAIHITAVKPIVVYSFTTQAVSSAATLCLPTNVLGKQYYAASYTQISASANANNFITIIAVEDNTVIEIIPTKLTAGGWAANSVNTINLNKGQIYQVLGALTGTTGSDLTGTSIRSVASGASGCKRIAVFSGSGRVLIGGCGNGADNLYQQLYPASTWGRKYLTVPSSGRLVNYYRIIRPAGAISATVKINGVVTAFSNPLENYHEFNNTTPNLIEADTSICVAQYFTSMSCQGNINPYDPDMVILNPVEQNIADVTLISTGQLTNTPPFTPTHYIHVIMKNAGTALSSFRFDGGAIPPSAAWVTHPQDPNYSYLYLNSISQTSHSLRSDSGFNAIAYGYANAETYAYSAGTNIKDLYTQPGIQSQYGIDQGAICTNSPFKFKISLPYKPDSIYWDLSAIINTPQYGVEKLLPIAPADTLVIDSITYVNSRALYWYSLPGYYTFTNTNSLTINITAFASNADGCGSFQDYIFPLDVSNPPTASFNTVTPGCYLEPVMVTETTPQFPKPTYNFWWEFYDPATIPPTTTVYTGSRTASHQFTTPGPNKRIRHASITTAGCLSDTIVTNITLQDIPNATINGNSTPVCINTFPGPDITFTATEGIPPFTFTYTIDAGAGPGTPQTRNSIGTSYSVTFQHPTNVAGDFIYNLTGVRNATPAGTPCTRSITGQQVTVHITPDATVTLRVGDNNNQTVCIDSTLAPIRYDIGGSGNGGSVSGLPTGVNYVFTPNAGGGVITITGSPTQTGSFTYYIDPTGPCAVPSPRVQGIINVSENGTLTLSSLAGTDAQKVCRNSSIAAITYDFGATATGASVSGLPPGVTWSVTGNRVTIVGNPTVASPVPYTYTVSTAGPCGRPSLTGTILVDELPTLAFNYTIPSCNTREITFTDNSVANTGTVTGWAWDFGDPASFPNNTATTAVATHTFTAPNPSPGYNVTLTVTTSEGCSNAVPFARMVAINHRPEAGFIVPDVCINDVAVVFTDTSKIASGAITGYEWDYGDGSPPTFSQHGSHLYASPNNYTVMQIVTSNFGCKDTAINVITISSADPVANFTAANQCSSDSVSLINLSTVGFGNVTKLEIYWTGAGVPEVILNPVFNGVYKHKYPTLTTTQTYNIRMIAYSGVICFNQKISPVTVYATPIVSFAAIPDKCYLGGPYQITQGSQVSSLPGNGTYSGPGIINATTGMFDPTVAGIGTHNIKYTWTTPDGCIDTLTRTVTVRDTAHAKFAVTLPSCEQTATLFTNQSTAPASVTLVSTVWDFGDGSLPQTFAIAAPVTHTYANPGLYTVRMHTVDNNLPTGCLSTDTIAPINIDANHHIQWDATSGSETQPLCVNTPIVPISYRLSGGATNVTFSPPLPPGLSYTVGGTPLTVTISGAPTVPNNYSFDVVTSGNTCVKDRSTINISVAPDHAIAVRAGSDTAQSVCLNTAIDDIYYDLSGGATGVNISGLPTGVNYTVTGNELRIFGTPTAIPPGGPGYTITTTGNSCVWATKIGEIVVHPYPVPGFTVDKPSYCIPNAIVKFTNTSTTPDGSGMTYLWDFGDGSPIVNYVHPTYQYTTGIGPFTVRLSVTSVAIPVLNNGQAGCNSFIDVPMTTIHPQPKVDFVYNKSSVCIGDNVTITDNTDGKDGIVNQWQWEMGDGGTRVTNPVTYTYADTITYDITMYSINSFGCNSDTVTKPFTVYPYPHVNAGPDRFVLEGGSIQLETITFANDPVYAWTPNLYLTDAGIARPRVMSPKTDMTYRLTVTARGGCALSDDVFVKLLKFPVIPNTFTPNGDGINDTWRIDFLNTYPDNRVQIFTRSGKLVFESKGYNTPWDGTIKGKPLPFDTYYYIIEPGNGRDPITGYITIIK